MRISRRDFIKVSGLFAAASFCTGQRILAKDTGRKLNVIYMIIDELGYHEVGYMGNKLIQTPNIDKLAAEGMVFTQHLAGGSVCAPTRCCLMTGKHTGHTSIRGNDGGSPLRAEEETIASMMKKAGYVTGGFGKWGLGGRGSTGVPEKHGFEQFVGYYDQVHAHTYYPAYLIKNSEELPLEGNKGGRAGKTYSHYVIMDEATKWLKANKDKPFFLYLPFTPPHGYFNIPESDPAWALYKDKPWPSKDAKSYAAMVTMIDRQLGEIIALLKETGNYDNTVIFFSGDNGGADYFKDAQHPKGFLGANQNPETGKIFRGCKGNFYEGGLRIPFIGWWPGHIKAGSSSSLQSYFPDVMPTIAELTGAECPKDSDGISMVPELLGEAASGRKQEKHEYLYWESGGQIAVRVGNMKGIKPGKTAKWELYDLDKDIEESNDLAEKQPDMVEKMKQMAAKAHTDVKAGTYSDHSLEERDRKQAGGNKEREAPEAKKGKKK